VGRGYLRGHKSRGLKLFIKNLPSSILLNDLCNKATCFL
jgi:hypothetical protein